MSQQPEPTERPSSIHDPEPLWRHVVGGLLREERTARGETLTETARRAGVSPQYLSEMERGLKEPSSEMLAAVTGALELTLLELTLGVAERVAPAPVVAPATPQIEPVSVAVPATGHAVTAHAAYALAA